jgi:type I restriction enzyme S subunit
MQNMDITYPSISPPAEQHRIVVKIDQLMAICDAMENQITSASAKQTTLLTALMARV